MSKLIKVFVYGTLKRGEPNHHWLTKVENGFAKFLTEGKTIKKFPLVIGTRYNIPFLLDKMGTGNQVLGEIYEVDENMFKKLDILEDYPRYYDREVQPVSTEEHGTLDCWLYIIRNYPSKLMDKKYLEEYHNTTEQPYLERSERDTNVRAIDDMSY